MAFNIVIMHYAFCKYLEQYKSLCPEITSEELDFIAKHLVLNEYNPKDFYLKNGEVQNALGYIISGLMKSYYIDNEGNEITVWFSKEEEYATDYPSFIRQIPAKYFIQCLEPSVVVNLSFENIQKGYNRYKVIERYGRLVTEEVLVQQQTRIECFLFQNAEQRYLDFITNSPGLFNRISLSDLSSYLGVERQSLSRIRKSIMQK